MWLDTSIVHFQFYHGQFFRNSSFKSLYFLQNYFRTNHILKKLDNYLSYWYTHRMQQ